MNWFLHAKIHKAKVTAANLDYIGSVTVDEDLLDKSGLQVGEKVLIASNTSGHRLETYIIVGQRGSGIICMNGAAAHLIKQGEEIIIMGFKLSEKTIEAKNVLVDGNNRFIKYL